MLNTHIDHLEHSLEIELLRIRAQAIAEKDGRRALLIRSQDEYIARLEDENRAQQEIIKQFVLLRRNREVPPEPNGILRAGSRQVERQP